MCSIGEDDFGDEGGVHSMPQALNNLTITELAGVCQKCNQEEVAVKLSFKEAECQSCFLAYVRHKFRATLGSSKILPKNADVLLVFDGGANSVTLLDMAHFAQTQNSFKRLHCHLKGLIVDDGFLGHQEPQYLRNVVGVTKSFNIEWYYTSLASRGQPIDLAGRNLDDLQKESLTEEQQLKATLEAIKSLTSKQEFLSNLHKKVVRNAATHLNCSFVFLAEICSDLATTFLANISLGRGCSTALDIGLVDDRTANLKLIRPLKDLTEAEVLHYVRLNRLPIVDCRKYGERTDAMASIQNLTKSFVDNLQEKFPSTVSTVFRTGSKITTKDQSRSGDSGEVGTRCRFCCSAAGLEASKTLLAIEFSRVVSESAANGLHDVADLEQEAREQLECDNNRQLCHACRNIFKDAGNGCAGVDEELYLSNSCRFHTNKQS